MEKITVMIHDDIRLSSGKMGLLTQLVSEYVRIFHSKYEVEFKIVPCNPSVVLFTVEIAVVHSPSDLDANVRGLLNGFIVDTVRKLVNEPNAGKNVTVEGVIGLPDGTNTSAFYDAWFQHVVTAYPELTVGAIVFVALDVSKMSPPFAMLRAFYDENPAHEPTTFQTYEIRDFCVQTATSVYNRM